MNENHKIDFAKKKGLTDEWYTPESAYITSKLFNSKIVFES